MADHCWPLTGLSQPAPIVRARVAAREVILATGEPDGLSVHNALPGTVSGLHVDPAFEHVIVQIAVGRILLLAEVTRDAIEKLGITVGRRVYALIKSVSIRLVEREPAGAEALPAADAGRRAARG